MILSGQKIQLERRKANIRLNPFDASLLNPNSYNYRLGSTLIKIKNPVLDVREAIIFEKILIPSSGYILEPGRLYLGHTLEEIGSDMFVPSLIGRSSLGRLGLFLQITADLGHLGTSHQWTLELKVVQPLIVYGGMRIGQVSFWKPSGPRPPAKQRYRDGPNSYAKHSEPTTSKMEKFFE